MRAVTADGRGALNLNQPELDDGFCRIAAKLAMGIYYEERRKIASPCTLINAFWTHNQREEAKDLMPRMLGMFPTSRHLKQGRKDTEDTFFISYLVDGPSVQVAAIFYESVALKAQFDDGADYTEGHDWTYTFTPLPHAGIKTVSADGDGDGMGAHEQAAVASGLATAAFLAAYTSSKGEAALRQADGAIGEQAGSASGTDRMGSTLVAATFDDKGLDQHRRQPDAVGEEGPNHPTE